MNSERYNPVSTGDRINELEKLLSLAEELLDKCEDRRREIDRYQFAQVSGAAIAMACAFLVGLTLEGLFVAVVAVCYFAALEYFIHRFRKRLLPDQMALSELVELIRETEPAIAHVQQWSTLERAQFKIRLSRFMVGSQT